MKKIITLISVLVFLSCSNDNDNPGNSSDVIPIPISTTNDLTDISFIDNSYGLISGTYGFLAKTSNGGSSWTVLNTNVNQSFTSTFMLNANSLYAARIGIYSSLNTGSTFSELGNLSTFSDSIFGIYFFNSNDGIIVKGNFILHTSNGGLNWAIVNNNQDSLLDKLQFVSSTVGYASGGRTFDGFSEGKIFKTIDGGLNWSLLENVDETSQVTSANFIDANTGFYFAYNNKLFKTIDGGNSWTEIENNNIDYTTSMVFIDANVGYVTTSNGKVLRTTNGGTVWNTIYSNPDIFLNKIIKTPNNTIFVVGNGGKILKFNS